MTIQERIEELASKFIKHPYDWEEKGMKVKFNSELTALLEQVAKEQRELCAEEFYGSSGMIIERILNAPSPLKEE